MLELRDLSGGYGLNEVLYGISLSVEDGETVVLLGANGAGKSTMLKAIIGSVELTAGAVFLDGEDISQRDVAANVNAGISLVPEGGRVFTDFTVERNLRLGAYLVTDIREYERRLSEIYEIFPVLKDRLEQQAGTLSGGERQMLAIARAMMVRPRLLMLDEPFLGLAPVVIEAVVEAIQRIKDEHGITLLIVEQNVRILDLATQAFAMQLGKIVIREDDPRRLLSGAGARRLEQAFIG